jgi:hypothetical protein
MGSNNGGTFTTSNLYPTGNSEDREMKSLIDRFFDMSDAAMAAYEASIQLKRDKHFPEAREELALCNALRNRMRMVAWNSPRIQEIVREQSGQIVEPDNYLIR